MKNNESIRVAVAETSVIIRSGLTLALKRLPNLKIQPVELLSVEALNDCLRTQFPDILVVNPTFGDFFDCGAFPLKRLPARNPGSSVGQFVYRCFVAQ